MRVCGLPFCRKESQKGSRAGAPAEAQIVDGEQAGGGQFPGEFATGRRDRRRGELPDFQSILAGRNGEAPLVWIGFIVILQPGAQAGHMDADRRIGLGVEILLTTEDFDADGMFGRRRFRRAPRGKAAAPVAPGNCGRRRYWLALRGQPVVRLGHGGDRHNGGSLHGSEFGTSPTDANHLHFVLDAKETES